MSLVNELEHGIESSEEEEEYHDEFQSTEIENPFFTKTKIFIDNKYWKCGEMSLKQFYMNFDRLLILCLQDGGTIDKDFYNNPISIKKISSYSKNLTLMEGTIKMLSNVFHKHSVVILDSAYLGCLNNYNLDLNDTELVLPLINISHSDAKLYLRQFTGAYQIEDYLKLKIMNNYYKHRNFISLLKIIDNLSENGYWEDRYNCKLNMTSKFLERKFSFDDIKNSSNEDILDALQKIPNEGDNYLEFLYRKQKYTDISLIINENGFKKYVIDDNIQLHKEDIKFIFQNISSQIELYKFVMNMLVSKKYNHLILNNEEVLDMLWSVDYLNSITKNTQTLPFMKRFIFSIKYAMNYAWMSLYMEESIKKSMIGVDDRFVFDINTASKLPCFPFNLEHYRENPYLSLIIASEIVNIRRNCCGVEMYHSYKYGVCNLDTFKERFNIFMTGNSKINIFDNVNWNNIAISGSSIPACATLFNPLMMKFNSTTASPENINFDRYFQEYYSTSDVDVMVNIKNDFEFIDKVHELYGMIKGNIQKMLQKKDPDNKTNEILEVKLKCFKTAVVILNNVFIKTIIGTSGFSYNEIINGLGKKEIKKFIYEFYVESKIKDNEKNMTTDKWENDRYNDYFSIVPIDSFKIIL